MGERGRIDWSAVRALYVEGETLDPDADPSKRNWPTLDELAATQGIHPTTVYRRSAKEHWPELRAQHQAQIDRARREALAHERGQRAAGIDQRALSSADAGLALIGHRLAFLVTTQARLGQGVGAGIDVREQSSLALAAWRWVRVKDAVLGAPNGTGDEPTLDELEREQRVEETLLAATLAARAAAREQDDEALQTGEIT